MSILEELYYGRLDPCESCLCRGAEYGRMTNDIIEAEDKLLKSINKTERSIYEEIIELRNLQEDLIQKEFFIYGFKLGSGILLESLQNPNKSSR